MKMIDDSDKGLSIGEELRRITSDPNWLKDLPDDAPEPWDILPLDALARQQWRAEMEQRRREAEKTESHNGNGAHPEVEAPVITEVQEGAETPAR
jgi:hypothetical protein